ncbi:MAG: hypothetical protein ALECFALPRED_001120 [Alectoria fallacina]|uniref:Uncharacterized protein n=1 Tax=Alectoria fallacina TaxID=1903189 RepID=A0A8H3I8Z2_9LECA|nr:MAG: hypothetical protein ALECFALPRED_001120 [Alectoria fallacina]
MSHINSPTTPGTTMTFMNSILDHRSPTTDQIFKTGIALSTHPSTPTIEPLPPLDYFLINQLIALARPHLTKRELKRMDYMADARRSFYECHHKIQVAYRGLLDAYACAEILDAQFEHLRCQLADNIADNGAGVAGTHQQLCAIGIQRRRNNEDMRVRLEILRARTRNRQHVAAWYSDLKMLFLRDEMPWLVALGKQTYDWVVRQRKEERPIMVSLPSPSPHHEPRGFMEGAGSDHCSDSGGTSTQESDDGSNGNEGEE